MKQSNSLAFLFLLIMFVFTSCESDEAKFARMEQEKKEAEINLEKSTPNLYLGLDNKTELSSNNKLVKQKLFGKDEYAFSHYSYDGLITNNAEYTSYRNVVVCFEFQDKEKNILDEFCYTIEEVVNVGEKQKFHLNIQEPKNREDIKSFNAYIKDAEVLTK
jgi:hypothetical protein